MTTQIRTRTDYADEVFKESLIARTELVSCVFQDCQFLRCGFSEKIFQSCRFVNCVFQNCDLSLAKIPDTSFSSVRFEDSKMIGIDWTQAAKTNAKAVMSIAFLRCALNHSTFLGLNLSALQMRDCAAVDVDFREADLSHADFAGTDLTQSMFCRTNLTAADLSRARNYALDPAQNTLKQAKFSLPEAMALLYGMDIILTDAG